MSGDGPWHTDCRLFTGFSPCRHRRACVGCPHHDPVGERVLLIQLDALGDVLRTTALLPAIRRLHTRAHITWLTRPEAAPLLRNNPLVDRVVTLDDATPAVLGALHFDLALCADKSITAGSLMRAVRATEKRGFSIDDQGVIIPLTDAAQTLYELGLDNPKKFFENQRSEQELMAEALGLPYQHDRYVVVLDDQERAWARADRGRAAVGDGSMLVGWNTGCGPRYPYKRFDVGDQVDLLALTHGRLRRPDRVRFVLLGGGSEDAERNQAIAAASKERGVEVLQGDVSGGLRRGLASIAACDMVVSGDSLGMHMAIGLKKPVVAWFGLTCHQEIDVYGRGIKVLADVSCRPCWMQSCSQEPKCFRTLPWSHLADAVVEVVDSLVRRGRFEGDRLVGQFPPKRWMPAPAGVLPGPIL
jgi:heptosyltransferase II